MDLIYDNNAIKTKPLNINRRILDSSNNIPETIGQIKIKKQIEKNNICTESEVAAQLETTWQSNIEVINYKNVSRKDHKGRQIKRTNKKNYHISFRDKITNEGLIDFIYIPINKHQESNIAAKPLAGKNMSNDKQDQQSCACLVY